MKLTPTLADRVAQRMRRDGFDCSASDVQKVWDDGTLLDNESLASAVLQEFDELGLSPEVGS